jgi:hypothetical protein
LVRGAESLAEWQPSLPPPDAIAGRELGDPVTDHRTSFVRRLATPRGEVFVKTYEYATWPARLRDFGRRTGPFARSRAAREFDALAWMRRQALPGPAPIAVLEWRRMGFLCRATLITPRFPGDDVAALLPALPANQRVELARAIGELVARLHLLGFRDGNLDLRNLIARRDPEGWIVAKVDSPRHRFAARGRAHDRQADADWRRLSPQLEPFVPASVARQAAARVTLPMATAGR